MTTRLRYNVRFNERTGCLQDHLKKRLDVTAIRWMIADRLHDGGHKGLATILVINVSDADIELMYYRHNGNYAAMSYDIASHGI